MPVCAQRRVSLPFTHAIASTARRGWCTPRRLIDVADDALHIDDGVDTLWLWHESVHHEAAFASLVDLASEVTQHGGGTGVVHLHFGGSADRRRHRFARGSGGGGGGTGGSGGGGGAPSHALMTMGVHRAHSLPT